MPVHVAIVREAAPGREAEFEEAVRAFLHDSMAEDGAVEAQLIKPAVGSAKPEYGILRTFRDEAAMEAFYASPRYAEWERRVAPLVVGPADRRVLHGMEAFFREPPHTAPPRWKMALLTWAGVFTAANLWSRTVGHHLHERAPSVLATAIDTGVVVIVLAWGVMPLLTKLLRGWLHPERAAASPERTT